MGLGGNGDALIGMDPDRASHQYDDSGYHHSMLSTQGQDFDES